MKLTSEQLEFIGRLTIHSHGEFVSKLNRGTPLRVKYGIDPTASNVHMGHAVGLFKLRQFQRLGHQIILIIGDFTAKIGDPTGRDKTRKPMTDKEIHNNTASYVDQIGKILDINDVQVHYNSAWFEKMHFNEVIHLVKDFTVSQMLERNDFSIRMKHDSPVYLHECLYPILQAYDSYAVRADVELGGNDQLFNLMMGRDYQHMRGMEPQSVLTVPILTGLDGTRRMGKSLNNYVGLDFEPFDMYSKTMSIQDHKIEEWWTLLPFDDQLWKDVSLGPMDAKKSLAFRMAKFFHGEELAVAAQEKWTKIYTKREAPDDAPEINLPSSFLEDGKIVACNLLVHCRLASSKNEAKRHISAGAATFKSEKIQDPFAPVTVEDGMLIRVGKRKSAKIKLSGEDRDSSP